MPIMVLLQSRLWYGYIKQKKQAISFCNYEFIVSFKQSQWILITVRLTMAGH